MVNDIDVPENEVNGRSEVRDVTDFVAEWAKCSHDVWTRWFRHRDDGLNEFIDVEKALFSALVIEELNLCPMSSRQFLSSTWVNFESGLDAERSVFVRQKSGGSFGGPKRVELDAGTRCRVLYADSTGEMIRGLPFLEVELGREYFAEPICDAPSYRIEYDPQS